MLPVAGRWRTIAEVADDGLTVANVADLADYCRPLQSGAQFAEPAGILHFELC
jgi:hypothetical protein